MEPIDVTRRKSTTLKSPTTQRKTTNNTKPKVKTKLSEEQLLLTLDKKRKCNARAQLIVFELIEPICKEDKFLKHLVYINQSHFEDIIEERSIIKICGYPLCQEKLTNVPNQQYRISRSTNRIFDITERKKFCSNDCYSAAMYIKKQMLTSPLWLREQEEIPDFKLLPICLKNSTTPSQDDSLKDDDDKINDLNLNALSIS